MVIAAGRSSGSTARAAGDADGAEQDQHAAGSAAAPRASAKAKGVSIADTSEQWAPPEQALEARTPARASERPGPGGAEDAKDAAAPPEPVPAPTPPPATPRRPSKRYPEGVRAALKSLRASLFAALQKKAQRDGLQYVHNLLLNAESYVPPEPKQRPALLRGRGVVFQDRDDLGTNNSLDELGKVIFQRDGPESGLL